jgi:hypothetical protein
MVDTATVIATGPSRIASAQPTLTAEQLAFLGDRYSLAPNLANLTGSAFIGRGMASFPGESGAFGEVGLLQTMLRDLGATDSAGQPLDVDGKFWTKTEQASIGMQQSLGIQPANGKWDCAGLQKLMQVHGLAQSNPGLAASLLGQESPLAQNALRRAASPNAQFAPGLRINPATGALQYTVPSTSARAAPQNGHPILGGLEGVAGARIAVQHPEWSAGLRERLENNSTLYNRVQDRVTGAGPADYIRQSDGTLVRQGRLDLDAPPAAAEPGFAETQLAKSKIYNRVKDRVTGDPAGDYIRQADGTLAKQYNLDFDAKVPEPHQVQLDLGAPEAKTGGKTLEALGEAARDSKVLKGVGRVAVPVAIAADAFDLGSSIRADADRADGSHLETKKAVGRIAGGWGGALAGAVIGQALIPIPVVGAVIGSVACGIGGSSVGEWLAKQF